MADLPALAGGAVNAMVRGVQLHILASGRKGLRGGFGIPRVRPPPDDPSRSVLKH